MSLLNVSRRVYRPFPAFQDRRDAGVALVALMKARPRERAVVLALPRGGVPVAEPIADAVDARLEVVVVRKLPLPRNPEAGFGAVSVDGSCFLNEEMVYHFGLSEATIERITEEVRQEVRRRALAYAGNDRPPEVRGMHVYLVDDGLATGYTMLAAATMVRKLGPESVTLCVPVSPRDSVGTVRSHFDEIHILFVQEKPPFAVASFYRDFHDLSDREVQEILDRRRAVRKRQ